MYELTNTELWRLFIAGFIGGSILGYLLTDAAMRRMLDKATLQNCELADHIDGLEHSYCQVEAENQEYRQKIREYESIFGADAIESYSKLQSENLRLRTVVQGYRAGNRELIEAGD